MNDPMPTNQYTHHTTCVIHFHSQSATLTSMLNYLIVNYGCIGMKINLQIGMNIKFDKIPPPC
jgi:hypothetical protein